MEKSIDILTKISDQCHSTTTIYKFSKDLDVSEKYRKGRISASQWLNELIYYYVTKEKMFLKEFKDHIQVQKISIDKLKDGEYKKGLYDQLNEIEMIIDDRIK